MTVSQYKLADALRDEATNLLDDILTDIETYTCDAMSVGSQTKDALTKDALITRLLVSSAKRDLLVEMARGLDHDRLFERGVDSLAGSEAEERGE